MIQTQKCAMLMDDEFLNATIDIKQFHEENTLLYFKEFGYTFIKWEWTHEVYPSHHLALQVTFEDNGN